MIRLAPVPVATIAMMMMMPLPCRAGEPAQAAAGVVIYWNADAGRVEVAGLPAATLAAPHTTPPEANSWANLLSVHVVADGKPDSTPVGMAASVSLLGAYALDGDALTFTPRFPLRPGLTYRATVRLDHETAINSLFRIPAGQTRPPAAVEALHPSADTLPENLLKFYIHFSAPMSRGEAYRRLHIIDVTDRAKPREVPDAFLRLGEELWDAAGQRFTLLFDPGRIKRGLVPNVEEGAPLVAGRRYALVVDRDWRDAHGQPLAASFRKEFVVAPFDDKQPDPHAWKLHAPEPGDTEPFIATLHEPLDHALLERSLVIKTATGEEVDGVGVALEDDTSWLFQPTKPWRPGDYQLVIDPILEDLVGNSVGRAFETEVRENVDDGTFAEAVTLPFKVVPQSRQ